MLEPQNYILDSQRRVDVEYVVTDSAKGSKDSFTIEVDSKLLVVRTLTSSAMVQVGALQSSKCVVNEAFVVVNIYSINRT